MARRVNRGEIWLYRFKLPDKRRPVLVLSRQDVIELLHNIIVVPVSSTIRGSPGEVAVGIDEGLKHESVINLDQVQTVERGRLIVYVGAVSRAKMREVCRALFVATGCDAASG